MMRKWWQEKSIAALGEWADIDPTSARLQMVFDAICDGGPPLSAYSGNGATKLSFDELLERFTSLGGRAVERSSADGGKTGVGLLVWDEGLLEVRRTGAETLQLSFSFRSASAYDACMALTKEVLEEQRSGDIYTLAKSMNSYDLRRLGQAARVVVRENYPEDVLEGYDAVVEHMSADEPPGRLVIINGPPGTGKTYLLRGLLSEIPESTFVLVPPAMMQELTEPTLLPALMQARDHRLLEDAWRRMILVVEDADACLAPRQSDNINLISTLLNLADGILGQVLDLRLIVTTNAKKVEVDPALLRPGRLCRRLDLGRLEADHVASIYERLTGSPLLDAEPTTLAEVYAKAGQAKPAEIVPAAPPAE